MWSKDIFIAYEAKKKESVCGGGEARIAAQHKKGKLTARERLEILFDNNSFVEIGSLVCSQNKDFDMESKKVLGDGVITGFGKVNGETIFACSEDFTVIGGTLGEYHSKKICKIMDMAFDAKAPFIYINDSGGARIEEGVSSLYGYGEIFSRIVKASGIIPQIAVIMGPCAGGACYAPAMCDFVFMTQKTSKMFITGPGVVKSVLGEVISEEELGGAKIHETMSGVASFVYEDDHSCLEGVKKFLTYLPQNNKAIPLSCSYGYTDKTKQLMEIVSDNQRQVYDVHRVIESIIDDTSFFEIQREFAKNIVVGFGRLEGEVIGIVANQPQFLGGSLDIDGSEKASRFVRFCDCFRIPILTFVDVPGFMPGKLQEHNGIIRRGAKLLFAYSEATVPKVTLVMRKAYGGAYIAMGSKGLGADIVYAWPIAQCAVMGAEGAVDIIFRKNIESSDDKEKARSRMIEEYNQKFMSPYIAAEKHYIDEVILPTETREKISLSFNALKSNRNFETKKVHGNMPL